MSGPTSIVPQPRIDTLVTDVATGAQLRRTEYAGTVWFGAPPDLGGFAIVTHTSSARIESPFYLPDSLPYRSDLAGSALVTVRIAIQSTASETNQFTDVRASLVADPRNPAVSWLQVLLLGFTSTPVAISYGVDVLVPPAAVLDGSPPAG